MDTRRPIELDMTTDGRFREPAATPLVTQIGRVAILVAVAAGLVGFLVFALWLALAMIPVVVGAGLIAWAAFRFQVWRARQSAASRTIYRP
jgi:hypothetical protein